MKGEKADMGEGALAGSFNYGSICLSWLFKVKLHCEAIFGCKNAPWLNWAYLTAEFY